MGEYRWKGSNVDRKEAARQCKERKIPRGIFAIRRKATGEAWVDASPNLGAARNGTWFQLRGGLHMDKKLQAEWNAHGEDAFEFEVLETLDDDVPALNVRDVLQEKKRQWIAQLGARPR